MILIGARKVIFFNTALMNIDLKQSQSLGDILINSFSSVIDEKNLNSLNQLIELFSGEIVGMFGVELNLSFGEKKADLLLCIVNNKQVLNELVSWLPNQVILNDDFYQNLLSFGKCQLNKNHFFTHAINNIWLEYDNEDIENGCFKPNVFFAPNTQLSFFELIDVTSQFFTHFGVEKLVGEQSPYFLLSNILRYLPQNVKVLQIGMMLARKSRELRLFLHGFQGNQLIAFLRKMNWGDDLTSLEMFIQQSQKWNANIDLDIDLSSKIGSKIGLECYPKSKSELIAFMEYLSLNGMIKPINVPIIEEYNNHLYQINGMFKRIFHHIKIVWARENKPYAKVYLGCIKNIY